MTIAVELLFVFVLAHLLPSFFNHASHDLPSFLSFKIITIVYSERVRVRKPVLCLVVRLRLKS